MVVEHFHQTLLSTPRFWMAAATPRWMRKPAMVCELVSCHQTAMGCRLARRVIVVGEKWSAAVACAAMDRAVIWSSSAAMSIAFASRPTSRATRCPTANLSKRAPQTEVPRSAAHRLAHDSRRLGIDIAGMDLKIVPRRLQLPRAKGCSLSLIRLGIGSLTMPSGSAR